MTLADNAVRTGLLQADAAPCPARRDAVPAQFSFEAAAFTLNSDVRPILGEYQGVFQMLGLVAHRLRAARQLIVFATLMAFAAGVVAFLRYDVSVQGVPLPVYTGCVYALLIGTAATVTSVALPALSAFVEATAIARLGAAVAAFGSPEFGQAMQQSPVLSATVVAGGAMVVRKLMVLPVARHWPVLARLPSRRLAA